MTRSRRELTDDDRRRLLAAEFDTMMALERWVDAPQKERPGLEAALMGAALRWRLRRQELGLELKDWRPNEPITEPALPVVDVDDSAEETPVFVAGRRFGGRL